MCQPRAAWWLFPVDSGRVPFCRALAAPGAMRRSWLDHKRIAAAIEARDPEAAAAAMLRHLERIGTAARRPEDKRDAA